MITFHVFMQLMYGLQHYPGTCTAFHSNLIAGGEGGSTQPVINVYQGNCLQAFWLMVQHYATYFSFGG